LCVGPFNKKGKPKKSDRVIHVRLLPLCFRPKTPAVGGVLQSREESGGHGALKNPRHSLSPPPHVEKTVGERGIFFPGGTLLRGEGKGLGGVHDGKDFKFFPFPGGNQRIAGGGMGILPKSRVWEHSQGKEGATCPSTN